MIVQIDTLTSAGQTSSPETQQLIFHFKSEVCLVAEFSFPQRALVFFPLLTTSSLM